MVRTILTAAVVGLLALVGLAPAASATYPPGAPAITCAPTSPTAGQAFTCTATGFDSGTTVTFTWAPFTGAAFGGFVMADSGSATATADSSGAATTSITIDTAGTYTVTASGTVGGQPGSAATTITVQAAGTATGGLPQTGAGNTGMLLAIAGGAMLVGGLAVVGSRARRQTKGASVI